MKRVERAIKNAEKLLPGKPTSDDKLDPRWQAIIKVGEYIETNPEEVWIFIRKWATHPNEDLRMAIATCLLEHLLQYHFNEYFPKVRVACQQSRRFAWTFSMCDQFGQTESPDNFMAFNELKHEIDGFTH